VTAYETWPASRTRVRYQALRRFRDGDNVIAVDQVAFDGVRLGETHDGVRGLAQRDVHVAREEIVFDDEQNRQFHDTCEIQCLVHDAFLRRAVTEVGHRDRVAAAQLRGEPGAHGQRDRARDDWNGAIEAARLIPQMH